MASIFGLEYNTPSEIKAARNQRWEDLKAQVAANPDALAAISAQQAMQNLAPDAEVTRAAELQKRLRKVTEENQQLEGEDDFDYQVRVSKRIRDSVADLNPELAIQANENVLKTSRLKQEMQKLKTQNEAERLALDEEIYTARQKKSRVIFGSKNGQNIPLKKFPPGTPDEVVQAALEGYKEEYGKQFQGFDIGNGLDFDELDEFDDGSGSGRGRSGLTANKMDKLVDEITGGKQYFNGVNDLIEDLIVDKDALAAFVSPLGGTLNALKNAWDTALDEGINFFLDEGYTPDAAKRKAQAERDNLDALVNQSINERNYGQAANVVQAKVKALAYQLAKAFDPNGRLSDQDVNMAMAVLTGKGDPDELFALLASRGKIVDSGLEYRIDSILSDERGDYDGPAKREVGKYIAARDRSKELLVQFYESFAPQRAEIQGLRQMAGDEEQARIEANRAAVRARMRRAGVGG